MEFKYIYKITNPKGKIYIGKTERDINKRINEYKGMWLSIQKQKLLYRSLRKYGWENHKFEIIYRTKCTGEEIEKIETIFIDFFNSLNCNNIKGLNIVREAKTPMRGRRHSEETKKKLSIASKGRVISEEAKLKISKAHRGRKMPDHVKSALQKVNIGNIWGKGRVKTEQELEKMRKARELKRMNGWVTPLKGIPRPQEVINKVKETKSKRSYKGINKGNIRNDLRKKVTSYNLDGSLYMNFESIKDALIHFGKKPDSTSHITRALRDNNKIVYNKYWKYEGQNTCCPKG